MRADLNPARRETRQRGAQGVLRVPLRLIFVEQRHDLAIITLTVSSPMSCVMQINRTPFFASLRT
jgi:hypothetical protein